MRFPFALILLAACADHPMSKTELVTPPAPTATLQTATFALG